MHAGCQLEPAPRLQPSTGGALTTLPGLWALRVAWGHLLTPRQRRDRAQGSLGLGAQTSQSCLVH